MRHTRNYFNLRIFGKRDYKEKSQNIEVYQRREREISKGIEGFKKTCTRARGKSLF